MNFIGNTIVEVGIYYLGTIIRIDDTYLVSILFFDKIVKLTTYFNCFFSETGILSRPRIFFGTLGLQTKNLWQSRWDIWQLYKLLLIYLSRNNNRGPYNRVEIGLLGSSVTLKFFFLNNFKLALKKFLELLKNRLGYFLLISITSSSLNMQSVKLTSH